MTALSSSGVIALFATVFLASAVEMVEALTIVVAVGVTKGWRSAVEGVSVALLALAVIVPPVAVVLPHCFVFLDGQSEEMDLTKAQ